ncbi:MAG: zf-HC2 domain-containing protein [Vulcanimicrobiaceae bacterium]
MSGHIGEDSTLYALGALEDADRFRIDEHVQTCAECARQLGQAEIAVADIEQGRTVPIASMLNAAKTRRWKTSNLAAIAAAVAFAILTGLGMWQNISLHRSIANTNMALAVLASSHFNHVSFVPASKDAPVAKAIYGKHGEWLYVIANTSQQGLDVYGIGPDGRRLLGRLRPGTGVETLFVNAPGRLQSLELTRDQRILARATPAYSK